MPLRVIPLKYLKVWTWQMVEKHSSVLIARNEVFQEKAK